MSPTRRSSTGGSGGGWTKRRPALSSSRRTAPGAQSNSARTTDSNVWGGASGHTYTFTRQPNGTTDIDVIVVREGKNLKGWVLGLVLGTIGRRVLEKAFENSVKAIEARNITTERLATGNSSLAA